MFQGQARYLDLKKHVAFQKQNSQRHVLIEMHHFVLNVPVFC